MTNSPLLDAGVRMLKRRLEAGVGWDPGVDVEAQTIRLQQCTDCGYLRYPRAIYCPECLSTETASRAISGRGTIWSFAVYHRAYDEAFAAALPYVVALVELDEGPQLIGAVIDAQPDELAVGQRVLAVGRELQPGQHAVYFRVVP